MIRRSPRNRMLAMRMRDSRRWTRIYREHAYAKALEESRRLTFLGRLYYVVTGALALMAAQPEDGGRG